jgi:hypothetical protein
MRYVKWGLRILVLLTGFLFFDYVLPQHDIVRVTGTEVIRMDFSVWNRSFFAQGDAGNLAGTTRDVRLIDTVFPGGSVMVYRNEDTGWIWPPYFKFDSSNLQARAEDLKSTSEAPRWVSVTHYGWRIPFLSIYPNAVGMSPVAGPDTRIVPWVNIVILTLLALLLFWIWRIWTRFRRRAIEPLVDEAAVAWDEVDDRAEAATRQARGWWGRITARLAGLFRR